MTVHLPKTRSGTESIDTLVDEIVAQAQDSLLEQDIARWREDLQTRLHRVEQHPEQGLGFIEEHIRQATLELQRAVVQKAMQATADAVDEKCSCCQGPLSNKKRRVPRIVDAYCGKVKLLRTHGWCQRCQEWMFPADRVLGLRDDSSASPLVQEMSALLVSKMPAEQAEALSLRVTGRSLSRSTMAREAQRQGDNAIEVRHRLVNAPVFVPPKATPNRCDNASRTWDGGIGFTRPPVFACSTGAAKVNPKPRCAPSSPNAATWPHAGVSSH